MEKMITFVGQKAKVACDENCKKAWGRNSRPTKEGSPDEWKADHELGDAPADPGTYEGGEGKPVDSEGNPIKALIPNKWCVRECERCTMSAPNQWHLPLELPKF